MDSLACAHRCHARCRASPRDGCAGSASDSLRDENLWLTQQLAVSEANERRWQERVRALKRALRTAEQQRASERAQWQQILSEKERKWTHEYDRHMQSLLQIIAHHEETHGTMRRELEELQTRADTAQASTQTERVASVERGQQTQYDVCCVETHPVGSGDPRHQESIAELVSIQAPSESIHEQYAALTMQKLLEQLRLSNAHTTSTTPPSEARPTPAPKVPAIETAPVAPSFRDSIIKRLADATDSTDETNAHRATTFQGMSMRRKIGLASQLPVLHELEEALQGAMRGRRDPPNLHFLSPSAA